MDLKKAIRDRTSRRTYLDTPVSPLQLEKLEAAAWECNRSSGLSIQIMTGEEEVFAGFKKGYGLFSGVRNYMAMVGKYDDPHLEEKIGYYGESLVLLATSLGLGTCWVGLELDEEGMGCKLKKDEVLKCVIAFGNVKNAPTIREKLIYKGIHMRKSKEIKDMLVSETKVPNWVVEGMRCVVKAPSARNRQPVMFYYSSGSVMAKVKEDELYDLGIAKLHFEIGAGQGEWEFGNGGIFQYEPLELDWESSAETE
ncbi:MAG: nitroreductase family protein [Anaerovoracaceae bacterium]|jgi:hypothetical protein